MAHKEMPVKAEKPKPSLHLYSDDLPELGKLSINDKITLRVSGIVTSLGKDYNDKSKLTGTIEITKIIKTGGGVSDEEYEEMTDEERERHFKREEKRITEKE